MIPIKSSKQQNRTAITRESILPMTTSCDYITTQPKRLWFFIKNLQEHQIDPVEIGDVENLESDYGVITKVEDSMEMAKQDDQGGLAIDKSNKTNEWTVGRVIG